MKEFPSSASREDGRCPRCGGNSVFGETVERHKGDELIGRFRVIRCSECKDVIDEKRL